MTSREITALALRIIALYILVHAVLALPNLFSYLVVAQQSLTPEVPAWWIWMAGAIAILAALIIAVIVWVVAGRAVAATDHQSKSPLFDNIEPLVLSVVGLFFIMQALIQIGQVASGLFIRTGMGQPLLELQMRGAGYLFQLLVGLSLVLRPLWWTEFLPRFRERPSQPEA
jgi:hypothetical protein